MSNVLVLLRREFNAYFASVLGYVVMMLFLIVMGVIFGFVVLFLSREAAQSSAMDFMFSMSWVPSLFVVPAITMRLLAEEKRAGTLEMLMTAPVTDFQVVLAKFFGAVVLYMLMWGLTFLYVLVLRHFAGPSMALDLGPVASGYIGVLVTGQFLIAIGLLASSLTKNQVAAALLTFAFLFLFLIVMGTWMPYFFPSGEINRVIQFLSFRDHLKDFARGIVDARPVVLYLSASALALFITTRVVESRKWR